MDFCKIHSIQMRFVIGLEIILFAGVCVCTFKPGNFTGWGSWHNNNIYYRQQNGVCEHGSLLSNGSSHGFTE